VTAYEAGERTLQEVAEPYRLMTADEFFDWSDGTDSRYELVNGVLYAQAATSRSHTILASRVITFLGVTSAATDCIVVSSGGGIRVSEDTVYIPDAAIVCDPEDNDRRYFVHPCLVVEVLSPSTETADRREKSTAYRGIESLLSYLVIYQDERRVERHWRDDANSPWQLMIYTGGAIPLPCIDEDLSLDELYRGLDFSTVT